MADCVILWIGDSLGTIERACIKSILRHGHSLALYCYRTPAGVPDGVEVRDASPILPRSSIPESWMKRSDLYSDWFRYEIQKRGLGIWLDLDVYLVAPLDLGRANLFGEYEPGKINGAVLRLPPDSPMLPKLLEPFEKSRIPDWVSWRWRLEGWARERAFGKADLLRTPFGVTGPYALTAMAHRCGLASEALPAEVFYPVEWREASWILDPSIKPKDVTTGQTVGIHLWNEVIRRFKNEPAPQGSFLRQLQDEGRE